MRFFAAKMKRMAMKFGFGQSVLRKEDHPLLRGLGRYVADLAPREMLHAVVVRSPHAHARFQIDAAKARAMPGCALCSPGARQPISPLCPATDRAFAATAKIVSLTLINQRVSLRIISTPEASWRTTMLPTTADGSRVIDRTCSGARRGACDERP